MPAVFRNDFFFLNELNDSFYMVLHHGLLVPDLAFVILSDDKVNPKSVVFRLTREERTFGFPGTGENFL
ncbi:hypothetical protein ACTXT7_004766 [Hymenolepis weldensis]